MRKITDTTTALNIFIDATTKHYYASENGDYKSANKSYAIIRAVIAYLKEQDKIQALSTLLDSSIKGVQLWAATYLLPVYETRATTVLETLTKGGGITAFTASTTLSEWQKGALKL